MATPIHPHRLGVPGAHVVLAEIVAVTSAMRRNARWSSTSPYAFARNSAKLAEGSMSLRRAAGPSMASSSTAGTELGTTAAKEPPRESDIMLGFESLRRDLMQTQDVQEFSASSLLSPFLELLKSPLSTGLINAVVLSSLHAFFVYRLITPQSVDIRPASVDLVDALSRLRFEGGDAATDELVSIKMLLVIEAIMTSAVGAELGDVEVCELLEAVLTICCQMRRGEALRRSAEATMHSLVRTVFSRLNTIDATFAETQLFEEEATEKARVEAEGREGTITPTSDVAPHRNGEITIPSTPNPAAANSTTRRYGLLSIRELLRVVVNLLDPTDLTHTDSIRLIALGIITAALSVSIDSLASFSRTLLPIISDKACRFLFQLVASTGTDGHNSDLSVLILERSLRIISMLLGEENMRKKLKLQQELFLSFTLDRLTPLPAPSIPNGVATPKVQLSVGGKGRHPTAAVRTSISSQRSGGFTNSPDPSAASSHGGLADDKRSVTNGEHEGAEPDDDTDQSHPPLPPRLAILPARGETRELLLSSLCNLALSQPTFVPDLWVNYDCDLNCEDIFDKLVNFLTADLASSQYGSASQQYTSQLLCLDLLLSFVNHMSQRVDLEYPEWDADKPSAEQMFALKAQKKLLLAGTARFNTKPKVGLAFLEEKGLIAHSGEKSGSATEETITTPRARTIASFLKKSPRLDKKLLGEYISRKDNSDILKEFISLYDFRGKSVGEALRDLLESFRLPGEAQQIDRIASTFAGCYFAMKPDEIKSSDAVYVLTFALIMLNTDQHSPNIRKRMTFEEFQRNLRGVNDNSDFPADYLRKIYDSIRKREIIMPQEHVGQERFDFAWKELMSRSENSESLVICTTNSFDESIFKLVWKPVVSAIATAFTTFDDEFVVQDVIAGFRQCATLAGKFQLPEVFDFLVSSLSRATGLLSDINAPVTVNYPIVEVDGQTVTVSPLSIRLGTSFRGQLAAVVLFTIANGNGNAIREGWTEIFEMFQTLFLHALLPSRMLQSEDFLGGVSTIPMQGNATTPVTTHPGRPDGGLLSTLSSYLMSPTDSAQAIVPEVADRDIEHTMSAIDCIGACRLDELYTQIARLDTDALSAALRALTELAKRRTMYPLSLSEYDEGHPRGRHEPSPKKQVAYDPASVFLLETIVSITLQTPDKIEEVWPIIFPHLSGVLASSSRFSVLLIERVVVGLLRIALILASNPALRDQLYIVLDVLNELPSPVLSAVAEQLIAGLSLLIRDHREVISSSTEWSLIFALIRDAASHHGASKPAFDLVSTLATSMERNPPARLDSLNGLIAILEEFAAVPGRALATRSSRKPPSSQTLSLVNGTIERGVQAIELIYSLKGVIPAAISQSTAAPDEAWKASWTPLLVALGRQSSSLSPDIRNAALSCMQRILLGPQLVTPREVVDPTHLFFQIIFPLVDDILSPELDDRRGAREMSDTRARVSTVLCKSFLYLELGPIPSEPTSLREIWLIILDFMERLMISGGQQNYLFEAVPETLKNVVLVMNASDILVRPSQSQPLGGERDLLWKETAERLEQFLPGFLDDLIPAATTPMPPPALAAETPEVPTNATSQDASPPDVVQASPVA